MLPEIAADVLHFLSRRDLDQACGVSKWLDALIAQCCEVFPLRRVVRVSLYERGNDFVPTVSIRKEDDDDTVIRRLFSSMDEAAHFAGGILRSSCVEYLDLGDLGNRTTLFRHHWRMLTDAIRSGAVQRIQFTGIDFRALPDDALLVVIGLRGLLSLEVTNSFAPSDFITDDLIRSSVAKGLLELCIYGNASDSPHRIYEDAVMDVYFPAALGIQSLTLKLNGSWLTDMFLGTFFERIRSRPVRPGILIVFGAVEQRGLAAYAEYLAPDGMHPTYRFPSTEGDNNSYEVMVSQGFSCLRMWISHV